MSAYHLSYLSLCRGCALFWDISTFWFFLLISTGSHTVLYSYQQMRRDYKIKFTDQLKANLWIHLIWQKFEKGLTSPYIVSYLHFLNLNNILTLPKLSLLLRLGLIWHNLCLPCFLPAIFTRMRASLRNPNKCKPSIRSPPVLYCKIEFTHTVG